MEQSRVEQPSRFRCSFCCFQANFSKEMEEHLVCHLTKSAHQCELCTFSIGTVTELYLHIQRHHMMVDKSDCKVNNDEPPRGKTIQVRSAIFECRLCGFVTKYKQGLQQHEIRHKEKSHFQCELCSYSVSTSFHLTLHVSRHHSAQQITPAPIQAARRGPLGVPSERILLQQARAASLPQTVPTEEVRAEPHIPPAGQIQLQPVTQNKWKVESTNQKGRDGSCLAPEPTEEVRRTVNGVKAVRLRQAHHSMTAFKASQRRKMHKLLLSHQTKNAMKKKLIKLKKKKSTPQEVDVVPVPVVQNPPQNAHQKKPPVAQMEAAAIIGHLENGKEEPVESNGVNEKLQKEDENEQEEEKYKCAHCEYSTLCWESMKTHSNSLHRKPPSAPSEVKKIKVENQANSKDILAASGRSENSEDKPVEFTRDKKKRLKTGNVQNVVFYCSDCEYFTVTWTSMKRHRVGHEREEKFKCDRCTFSTRVKCKLSFHSNHYHCKPPSASLELKKVKKEPKFKEDPTIDEQ